MGNVVDHKLSKLLGFYGSLEKVIQRRINQVCFHFCDKCPSKCCREEICRESVESAFLSRLIGKQEIRYDPQKGWMSPTGCRLHYGRPLVCYEFFCEDITKGKMFQTANLRKIAHEFVSVGNKARGKTHLICIDNLDLLSATKMDKMISKMKGIADRLANPGSRPAWQDLVMKTNDDTASKGREGTRQDRAGKRMNL